MGINEAIKAGCSDARLLHTFEPVGFCFMRLDGFAERLEQRAEQPVGEHQPARKGKAGPVRRLLQGLPLPKLHTREHAE